MLRWLFIWECLSHLHFTRQSCRAQILSPGALCGPSLPLSPWLALKSALYPDPGAEGLVFSPRGVQRFHFLSAFALSRVQAASLPRSLAFFLLKRRPRCLQTPVSLRSPLWYSLVPARSPMVSAFLWGLCWLLLHEVFVVFEFPDSSSCCLAPAGSSSAVSISAIILFASRVPI